MENIFATPFQASLWRNNAGYRLRYVISLPRMRAKETGRYLLRATNTGISAVIGPSGDIAAQTKLFERAVLTADITPLAGATPYVRLGNAAPVAISLLMVMVGIAAGRRGRMRGMSNEAPR